MTPERRAALMAYCRIEAGDLTAEEETLLEGLYGYAVGYMAQAGVAEPEEGSQRRAMYDLCVNALVLDAWDRRGVAVSERGTFTSVENLSFRRLLNQMKLTEHPAVPSAESGSSGPRLTAHLTAPPAEAGSVGPRLTEPAVSKSDTGGR